VWLVWSYDVFNSLRFAFSATSFLPLQLLRNSWALGDAWWLVVAVVAVVAVVGME
jgi:hypothetical protein